VANDQGWTPLHYAAENNHVEMLRLLMGFGADPKATIASGATALSLACRLEPG
jgi:ankyrin repeat protein